MPTRAVAGWATEPFPESGGSIGRPQHSYKLEVRGWVWGTGSGRLGSIAGRFRRRVGRASPGAGRGSCGTTLPPRPTTSSTGPRWHSDTPTARMPLDGKVVERPQVPTWQGSNKPRRQDRRWRQRGARNRYRSGPRGSSPRVSPCAFLRNRLPGSLCPRIPRTQARAGQQPAHRTIAARPARVHQAEHPRPRYGRRADWRAPRRDSRQRRPPVAGKEISSSGPVGPRSARWSSAPRGSRCCCTCRGCRPSAANRAPRTDRAGRPGAEAVKGVITDEQLQRSLTWDRGTNWPSTPTPHRLRPPGLLRRPHRPWQRGTDENTNGLLHQ
jgi:hypothetical protein